MNRPLIVDDQERDQRRLCALLGLIVDSQLSATVARTVNDAKTAANSALFDVMLIDIDVQHRAAIELIAWMQQWHPGVVCIVVTTRADDNAALAAVRAGAGGYLLKQRDDAELVSALRDVQRGGVPIDPLVTDGVLSALRTAAPALKPHASARDGLSWRERQILDLVAHGRNNREIAETVGLSRFTVEGYTKQIYRKLDVGSRAAAVFEAQAMGLLH